MMGISLRGEQGPLIFPCVLVHIEQTVAKSPAGFPKNMEFVVEFCRYMLYNATILCTFQTDLDSQAHPI
jgi:hypothetical protein